jgi:hypothetical protein
MITSRDIKFIFMGILIFLISRYLYDRFFRPQKRPQRKSYRKRPRIEEPFNIKEKC